MKKNIIITAIASMLLIAGCGMTRLERDYGTSYRLARFNQTLDPEAEKNLKPVTGMSGPASQLVIERYYKDFEKHPAAQAQAYSINSGSFGK